MYVEDAVDLIKIIKSKRLWEDNTGQYKDDKMIKQTGELFVC